MRVVCWVCLEALVRDGFAVLEGMPEWYKAMLAGLVASSVGLRGLSKWKG